MVYVELCFCVQFIKYTQRNFPYKLNYEFSLSYIHFAGIQPFRHPYANRLQETMPSAPADVTQSDTHVTQNVTQSSTNDSKAAMYMLTPRQQQILQMMQTDGSVSASTMAVRLGFTVRTIRRDIETLRKYYTIRWIGSSKQGHWQILPQNVEQ